MKKNRTDLSKVWQNIAPLLGIGWFFVIAMLGGLFLGMWLDRKFHTEPWLMLLGIALGMFIGFYNFFKVVSHVGKGKSN